MYCYLVVAQGYRRSLPTSKYPSFICRDIYKLHATIYATGSGNKTSSTTAYSLICISAHKNLFRTDTSDVHRKREQCSIKRSKINCPLFVTDKTYSEFFLWNITTFAVKIVYKIDEKNILLYTDQSHHISSVLISQELVHMIRCFPNLITSKMAKIVPTKKIYFVFPLYLHMNFSG